MPRKLKKKLRKSRSYYALGIFPEIKDSKNNLKKRIPKRGDRVLDSKGRTGTFVGVDPRGLIRSKWIAFDEYAVQFPFDIQCRLFDKCFPGPEVHR